jgi:hypothetical protein
MTRFAQRGEEVSRLEILVWACDILPTLPRDPALGIQEREIVQPEHSQAVDPGKKGKPRYPKSLQQPWQPSSRVSEN